MPKKPLSDTKKVILKSCVCFFFFRSNFSIWSRREAASGKEHSPRPGAGQPDFDPSPTAYQLGDFVELSLTPVPLCTHLQSRATIVPTSYGYYKDSNKLIFLKFYIRFYLKS